MLSSPVPLEVPKMSLSRFIFTAAKQYADLPCMVEASTGRSLTYGQFISNIEKVSSGLKKRGLSAPNVACLVLPTCMEHFTLQFAIMATGATVTALHPSSTLYELTNRFNDCKPRFIFTNSSLLDLVTKAARDCGCGERIFLVDKDKVSGEGGLESFQSLLSDDGSAACLFDETIVSDPKSHVAYLNYSGGSTGIPKGVMLSHYSMCYGVKLNLPPRRLLPAGLQETCGLQMQAYHSTGVTVGAVCFYRGVRVIIFPPFEPRLFLENLSKYKVNYTSTVPYFLVKLIDCPFIKEYDLSNLFLIGCAASSLSGELEKKVAKTLHEANPNIDLAQGYGLTEAGIYFLRVPPKMFRLPGKEGSVGMKPTNIEFKIVPSDDVDMKIEGAKEIGEIWLRTPAMMLGYYKQPEKTREAFPEDGWLKTGDIGYLDADNYLFLVDRVKHLIKCNSMHVSTAELENNLLSHPSVADAGVLGVPHPEMGEVPRAYVVRRNQNVTEEELCKLVADRLIYYKQLHGGVCFVDHIPRTPTGKVDQPALKALFKKETSSK